MNLWGLKDALSETRVKSCVSLKFVTKQLNVTLVPFGD